MDSAPCGCEENGQQFCNFDYGADGFCEPCSNFEDIDRCYNDGLPSAGADDCAMRCFNAYALFDHTEEDEPTNWLTNDAYALFDLATDLFWMTFDAAFIVSVLYFVTYFTVDLVHFL